MSLDLQATAITGGIWSAIVYAGNGTLVLSNTMTSEQLTLHLDDHRDRYDSVVFLSTTTGKKEAV